MAACSQCGADLREGDWACGACGAPVRAPQAPEQGAPYDPAGYGDPPDVPVPPGAQYGAPPPGAGPAPAAAADAAPPAPSGLSGTVKLVLVLAGVSVVAIVLVWFFLLRPAGPLPEFAGTWRAAEGGNERIVISRSGDDYLVDILGPEGTNQSIRGIRAQVDDRRLVFSLEDIIDAAAAQSGGNQAAAEAVKAMFAAQGDDMTFIFEAGSSDDRLTFAVEGDDKERVTQGGDDKVELERVAE